KWYKILDNSSTKDKKKLTILKVFQYANTIIPTLSIKLPIFLKDKLT
ncbi:33786_t:CDS:1, partial [Racocetra persica]